MMENPDQNSDYALRAIQEPRLRETEEFNQWISVPENKELFLDLMACKEAVMRESLTQGKNENTYLGNGFCCGCRFGFGLSYTFFTSFFLYKKRGTGAILCRNCQWRTCDAANGRSS